VLGAVALLVSVPGPPAGASPTAVTLYAEAIATTKAWSVHYASEGKFSKVPILESGDAGPASGSQEVLIGAGATADDATLIVIGDLTYVKGNIEAMEDLLLLPADQAATAAGQWVLFSTDNPDFSQVVAGVRSHDVATELALKGPYTAGAPRRLDGDEVDTILGTLDIQGHKPLRAALYVCASAPHDIVEEDTVNAQGMPDGMEHTVYSKWGERVRPKAPPSSLSIGKVSGT